MADFPEILAFLVLLYGVYKLVYKIVDKKLNSKGDKK